MNRTKPSENTSEVEERTEDTARSCWGSSLAGRHVPHPSGGAAQGAQGVTTPPQPPVPPYDLVLNIPHVGPATAPEVITQTSHLCLSASRFKLHLVSLRLPGIFLKRKS